MTFFIVNVEIPDQHARTDYDQYIAKVKPIVEGFGGRYIVRSENVTLISGTQKPDRVIVVEFENREALDRCFSSPEYRAVKSLRENSVKTTALIVEQA
ncbi:MAG: DUF1330 domain-containing protein [Bacteroidales bacterium]|nr:DUF1330 domain-containing protein [Bacteroidales bacterium]